MAWQRDILEMNLLVVFCGLNPGLTAIASGHSFSHGSNRFWRVLHLAGFTDEVLQANDERDLLNTRCGLTTAVLRATSSGAEVSTAEFRRSRASFEKKMRRYAPHAIAFLGKAACAAMLGARDVSWGRQEARIAGIETWVLPNPSGRNLSFTLPMLVEHYTALRRTFVD